MWPNESAEYRKMRDRLLEKEAQLRALTEAVAAERRALPMGGEIVQDYVFERAKDGSKVTLSEMFEDGKDTLFAYNLMYAPGDEKPCAMCGSLLDGLEKVVPQLNERMNLAIIAKAGPQDLQRLADSKGWKNLPLYSAFDNSYNADYKGEDTEGNQLPMMHVWRKENGTVQHFWASELFFYQDANWDQQPRHADTIWPLWNVLDLTPQGRGLDWYPKV